MIACTIAGSDSGGGAGIQADLKTFQELRVYGTSAITAITAQNTLGVHGIYSVESSFVEAQLKSILDDFDVKAIKTGMLLNANIITSVANILRDISCNLVIDPVMVAKSGQNLLLDEAVETLKNELLPLATICTPNIPEAEVLSGMKINNHEDIENAAKRILSYGVKCVVMKGGHLNGNLATDAIFIKDELPFYLVTDRFETRHLHGTGCTFSAAITAQLAKGFSIREAVIEAKRFVDAAIKHPLNIGQGFGPTNHFAYKELEGKQVIHVF